MKSHYVQPRVGHYGVFNGSRFRKEIAPRMLDFMRARSRFSSARSKRKKPAA
jgi:poly(3-hydroxybutyrate) depolymerase